MSSTQRVTSLFIHGLNNEPFKIWAPLIQDLKLNESDFRVLKLIGHSSDNLENFNDKKWNTQVIQALELLNSHEGKSVIFAYSLGALLCINNLDYIKKIKNVKIFLFAPAIELTFKSRFFLNFVRHFPLPIRIKSYTPDHLRIHNQLPKNAYVAFSKTFKTAKKNIMIERHRAFLEKHCQVFIAPKDELVCSKGLKKWALISGAQLHDLPLPKSGAEHLIAYIDSLSDQDRLKVLEIIRPELEI